MSRVAVVDPARPDPAPVERAADVLRRGGLVAFPTETVYGLGANALDAQAVERIYQAKGRPARNPIIVHVADSAQAQTLVTNWPVTAERLARAFWPGPLTLVLPRKDMVPAVVAAGGPTVGLRVPAHPIALALLRAARLPIAAPSANSSNRVSPTLAQHVLADLGDRVDLILDGGPCPGGLESTVLDLTTTPSRLLRPGLISPAEIEAVIGPIGRLTQEPVGDVLASPGLLPRHYAPRAPLEVVDAPAGLLVQARLQAGQRVGWLCFECEMEQSDRLCVRVMPRDPLAYAAILYQALHDFDERNVDRILAERPPDDESWLAIRDRLGRASTSTESR